MGSDGLSSKFTVLLLIVAGLFLSSLACNSIPFLAHTPTPTATSTPTPTETPTRTNTPTITPTFTPSLTPTQSYLDWPVLLSDSFDDSSHGWYEGPEDDDYLQGTISITEGRYLADVTAKKGVFYWLNASTKNLSDFYLAADAEKTGSTSADFGLVFRDNSDSQYYFAISSDSQSYIFLVYDASEWSTIIEWTSASQIKTDGANHIAILAQGSSFTFFINGESVDQTEDSTLKSGKVGVAFSLSDAGEKAVFAFDNFEVTAPK